MTQSPSLPNSGDAGPGSATGPLAAIGLVSAIAAAFLFWLIYFKAKAAGHAPWVEQLPWLNAIFNGCAAIFLVRGYLAIRSREIEKHRQSMLSAFAFSCLFLLSYVLYHAIHEESKFPGQGWVRPLYFSILISHIGLSVVSLPLILSSLYFGLSSRIASHRKVARWTFPMWLYVSVTGVLIVLFLKGY